ncbi:MAG: hypothetical protein HY820_20380, partial [Acidobacteria bacterium]|nr:hypothetical protein [Acidobacteriota bacterium]
ISGVGETTIVKDWDRYLYRLVEAGMAVSIITNLAKAMPDRAIQALSHCKELSTSCDTVDASLYAAIRQGADFYQFLQNNARVRVAAIAERRKPPYLIWNCVANDRVIFGLRDWVAVGMAVGVDHFQLSDLAQYPDLPDAVNVRPLAAMTRDELWLAKKHVMQAKAIAEGGGKWFGILPAVEEALNGRGRVVRLEPQVATADNGAQKLVSIDRVVRGPATVAGMTRNCIAPWNEAFLWANRAIAPCCQYKRVGELNGHGISGELNGVGFQEIREGLLTGNLTGTCRACPMFGWVPVEQLRQRVEEYLDG